VKRKRQSKRRAPVSKGGTIDRDDDGLPCVWDSESDKHVQIVDIEAESKRPLRPDLYPPPRAGAWIERAIRAYPPPGEVLMWIGRIFCEPMREINRPQRGRPPGGLSYEKTVLIAACVAIVGRGTKPSSAAREVAELARRGRVMRPGSKPVEHGTVYEWWKALRKHDDVRRLAHLLKDLTASDIAGWTVAELNRLAALRGEKSTAF
jgi:hypothetical protein